MIVASTPLEDSSLPPVGVVAVAELASEASLAHRQEFENILPQVLPRFRRIAARWLGNRDDAEDAIQDAMVSAFTHITRFSGRAKMSTWLTAIVINAVRMQMRRRRRGRMLSLDYSLKDGQQAISELLADPHPTPERAVERLESYALAIRLARGLAPSQWAALRLCQQNEFSIREAAKKLGVPEGTLKAQLARGRAKLTQRFHEVTARPKIRVPVSRSRRAGCQSI